MGLWSWFAERVDDLVNEPVDNVNNGVIANPFLVKKTPDADHYFIGAQFGDVDGTAQSIRTEFWVTDDSGLVHVGRAEPTEKQPSYALAAVTNGLLRLVPSEKTFVVPGTERLEASKVVVKGPAYILQGVPTAVDSFRNRLNADLWIEGGLAPPNRPVPSVVVYENVDVPDDIDELVKTWYKVEKKLPFWTDARLDKLVQSWKEGESTVYVKAGYPIGQPAKDPPDEVVRPALISPQSRYVPITVYDEFGIPIDLGWLLRHASRHAENELLDNLVSPDVAIFRKDPVRNKLKLRDIIDIRDEFGLPFSNRAFRLFEEAEFPPLTSVFDTESADLVLQTEPQTTGAAGLWTGLEVNEGDEVVIQGVGLTDHLLAFLPNCSSSTVVIKLRGYPGDYHRIIALSPKKWFPEQPNARVEQAPKRFHLGCRATPLVDGQSMLAAAVDAMRATYERAETDPESAINLRPAQAIAEARIWIANWQISPAMFGYGGSPELYDSVNSEIPGNPNFSLGKFAYPLHCLGFYLQSAIAAGVDVRLMPWFNIFSQGGDRGQNIEFPRAVNHYYDLNAYHTATGPLPDAQRNAVDVTNMDPIPPNLHRGFGFVDNMTRSQGAHHQKVSFIRNRYGDFAFLGGIDFVAGRWDTNEHRSPEPRKPARDREAPVFATQGWHDVHVMLEGCVVQDAVQNFFQRWNAFVADPPDPVTGYPVDLTGLTPIQTMPVIPELRVPHWPGPNSELPVDAEITPHERLDRGPEGRRPRRATHICSVVRTIPPYIDAYDSFVKARPIPDDGKPLGELGCRVSYLKAIENARNYIYIEDQYFVEPDFIDLLIARLTHPDRKQRLRRLFVLIPYILADNPYIDAIYHHHRTQHTLRIREAIREMLATEGAMSPENVPKEAIDSIFTIAHLEHPSGSEIYIHAKQMIVDDIWMIISSSNISRRGMSYETEIGAAISDAEVEDGVRKVVRDHRIRLWAEHLKLDRSHWHRLLDPIAGAELMRKAIDNPNLALIPFEIENNHIKYRYAPEDHTSDNDFIYKFLGDPDGRILHDPVQVDLARTLLETELGNG